MPWAMGMQAMPESKVATVGNVSLWAGDPGVAGTLDGDRLTTAQFGHMKGIFRTPDGVVWVTSWDDSRFRMIDPADDSVTTRFAGSGLSSPWGTAFDSAGVCFSCNYAVQRIYKITTGGVLSSFAGSGTGSADGTGGGASFNRPEGMAIDASDNLYVADNLNGKIRKITPARVVTTVATAISVITDVCCNTAGTILYAVGNNVVTKTVAGVTTVVAGSSSAGYVDDVGGAARFNGPSGIAVDAAGVLWVADSGNNRIRRIATDGTVTTFAGSTAGFADGIGAAAKFDGPSDVIVAPGGVLYVTDYNNYCIRRIDPV